VSRGLAELASLKQLRALIRETLRSSAQPEGWFGPSLRSATKTQRAFASLGLNERSKAYACALPTQGRAKAR
ncbi:hypothetical protein, partial [Variovorax sp. CY25R-8]|uniref:hypothetical protein n=1 Tax=Variovorax sp. CY25R-8 TaxID=2855501 RepID=UPI0021BA7EE4